jgi:hypothetical protein
VKYLLVLLLLPSCVVTAKLDKADIKALDEILEKRITQLSVETGVYQMGPDPQAVLDEYNR